MHAFRIHIPLMTMTFMPCWWPWHSCPADNHDIHALLITMTFISRWWPWHSYPADDHDTHALLMTMTFMPCWWPWHSYPADDHDIHALLMTMTFMPCWWPYVVSEPAGVALSSYPNDDIVSCLKLLKTLEGITGVCPCAVADLYGLNQWDTEASGQQECWSSPELCRPVLTSAWPEACKNWQTHAALFLCH